MSRSLGGRPVHDLAVDGDRARGGLLQTGNQAQGGRLAAARRPHQDQQFLVFNDEAEVIHGANTLASRALEDLGQMLEDNLCHAEIVEGQALKVEAEPSSKAASSAPRWAVLPAITVADSTLEPLREDEVLCARVLAAA